MNYMTYTTPHQMELFVIVHENSHYCVLTKFHFAIKILVIQIIAFLGTCYLKTFYTFKCEKYVKPNENGHVFSTYQIKSCQTTLHGIGQDLIDRP